MSSMCSGSDCSLSLDPVHHTSTLMTVPSCLHFHDAVMFLPLLLFHCGRPALSFHSSQSKTSASLPGNTFFPFSEAAAIQPMLSTIFAFPPNVSMHLSIGLTFSGSSCNGIARNKIRIKNGPSPDTKTGPAPIQNWDKHSQNQDGCRTAAGVNAYDGITMVLR